jgi:hypothetical protein
MKPLAIAVFAAAAACAAPVVHAGAAPPLVDGDCGGYAGLGAQSFVVAPQVRLYVWQDAHYVWLCHDVPAGSFGAVDLRLAAPALAAPLVLHVSAQLGEWPADKPDHAPATPESPLWWNTRGWTANPVWINGMDRSGPTPRPRFRNAPAREIQLAKQRFGRGVWAFSLEIHGIAGHDAALRFPARGEHRLDAG